MRRHSIFTCILLSLLIASPKLSVSQTAGRDIREVYERKDNRFWGEIFSDVFKKQAFNKSYALVIGLSDYSGEWGHLESPYYDAVKVRDYLINKEGFDYVVTLTNKEATKDKISWYMEEILPAKIQDTDRFLFYYSGHGTQRDLGNRIRGYLPMLNSGKKTWADMISMDDIEGWNQNVSKAKHVVFVLDCCFSGLAGTQKKGDGQKLYLEDLSKYGHHLITAGTANQRSYGSLKQWGGSLFTEAFIRGISGKADTASADYLKDGVVSLTELDEYIKKKVKEEAAKNQGINQSPQVSDLDENEGEFFFVTEAKRLNSLVTENEKDSEYGRPVEKKGEHLPPVIVGKDNAEMVLIPAGEFQMGTDAAEIPELVKWAKQFHSDANASWFENETLRHTVYLDVFYMDVHEVTHAQYKQFLDATGHTAPKYWTDSTYNDDDQPVVGVTWYDAAAYCQWAKKRLPTEAEWEKAARGGLVGKKYPLGDSIDPSVANYLGGVGRPTPFNRYPPNNYGLYDMAGNVWEWCADWYDAAYYQKSPDRNPQGPDSGEGRVLRGGSWGSQPNYLRVANRFWSSPGLLGFRCARAVSP